MPLYTRKRGEFVKLDKMQVRRFRRTEEVIALQRASENAARTMCALAAWLGEIAKKDGQLNSGDFRVASMPNAVRMREQAQQMLDCSKVLKWS